MPCDEEDVRAGSWGVAAAAAASSLLEDFAADTFADLFLASTAALTWPESSSSLVVSCPLEVAPEDIPCCVLRLGWEVLPSASLWSFWGVALVSPERGSSRAHALAGSSVEGIEARFGLILAECEAWGPDEEDLAVDDDDGLLTQGSLREGEKEGREQRYSSSGQQWSIQRRLSSA